MTADPPARYKRYRYRGCEILMILIGYRLMGGVNLMGSIWNGAISFGLVIIPVNLFAAEENNDLKFSYIDFRDENKNKIQKGQRNGG